MSQLQFCFMVVKLLPHKGTCAASDALVQDTLLQSSMQRTAGDPHLLIRRGARPILTMPVAQPRAAGGGGVSGAVQGNILTTLDTRVPSRWCMSVVAY